MDRSAMLAKIAQALKEQGATKVAVSGCLLSGSRWR